MFYFHNNLKSHKVFNASLQPKYFTLPKQSGVLATEEDVTTNTLVSMIQKPTITFPENDSIDYDNVINYTHYIRNPLYLGSKTHISFEAAFDIGFTNIFRSEKIEDADELNTTIPLPLDISKTTLYIRIKYHSGLYSSPWSDPIKVTTKDFKINVPTIITPTNNANGINKNIVISTSDFSYVGVVDTHESTTYQIADDVNFNSIVFNSTSITALTSIIATMQEGKTYFLRVKHTGTKYGSSNWSTIVKVSTLVPIISEELVYYRANIDDRNYIYFDLLNSSWTYYFSKWDNNTHIQSMIFNSKIYPIQNIDSYNGINLRLVQYEGRNGFSIIQQPTKANGFKAIIHMFDPQHGANWYSLRLYISSVY